MRNSKLRKPFELTPEEFFLQREGFDFKDEVEASAAPACDPLATVDTMGALTPDDLRFVGNNCHITIGKLGLLIETYLQLQYLLEPVKQALGLDKSDDSEQVRVGEVLRVLLRGDFYRYLRDSLPKCIINNRTTSTNVEILVAALQLYALNKLSLDEIKETIVAFTLQEREHQIDGVFLEAAVIMNMLKHLNRTISNQALKNWLGKNTFSFENFLMPWQFLYLACQCPNRDVYLRKICKLNFKSVKMPNSKLYLIQPLKEIAGTPDFKIQQQLAAQEGQEQPTTVRTQGLFKYQMAAGKACKGLSRLKEMLRQENIYRDIKNCLAGREKSENLKECLQVIQPKMSRIKRPYDSVVPITETSMRGKSVFQKGERIKTTHSTFSLARPQKQAKQRPVTSNAYHRSPTASTKPPTASKSSLRTLYQRELSNLDLNKQSAHCIVADELML